MQFDNTHRIAQLVHLAPLLPTIFLSKPSLCRRYFLFNFFLSSFSNPPALLYSAGRTARASRRSGRPPNPFAKGTSILVWVYLKYFLYPFIINSPQPLLCWVHLPHHDHYHYSVLVKKRIVLFIIFKKFIIYNYTRRFVFNRVSGARTPGAWNKTARARRGWAMYMDQKKKKWT